MALGKEILAKRLLARKIISIPKWGGEIIVRELTKTEAKDAQQYVFGAVDLQKQTVSDADKLARFNVRLIRLGWIDEDGQQVLSPNEEAMLFEQSNDVLEYIGGIIADMSGIGGNSTQADMEEAKKN